MIHSEIERLCSAIKHVPDSVDLEDVRLVLRSAQHELERAELLKYPEQFSVAETEDGAHEVAIQKRIPWDDRAGLIAWIFSADN